MPKQLDDPAQLAWERRILARVRAGDRQAWGELYEAFAPALYAQVLMPRLCDSAAAEDVLAEVFRTAMDSVGQGDGKGQFEDRGVSIWFWLARVAANKAADVHRGHQRQARLAAAISSLAGVAGEADSPRSAAELRLEARGLRMAVSQALAAIPARYRRAIELRFFEENSREEAARALGVKVPTFDVVLLRALRAFRAAWAQQEDDEP